MSLMALALFCLLSPYTVMVFSLPSESLIFFTQKIESVSTNRLSLPIILKTATVSPARSAFFPSKFKGPC